MNGHSDVIMGSVALNNAGLAERLKFIQNATGAVPSPFDCFLVNRRYVYILDKWFIVKWIMIMIFVKIINKLLFQSISLKTLKLRMDEHMKNGLIVANFLESSPFVLKVISPALPSHPQYDLILRQQYGHSGMIAFYLKGMTPQNIIIL